MIEPYPDLYQYGFTSIHCKVFVQFVMLLVPEHDGSAGLEVLLLHRLPHVVHRGQRGHYKHTGNSLAHIIF